MKRLFVAAVALSASMAMAQQVCDVVYTVEAETKDGQDVLASRAAIYGVPFSDVKDNSQRGMRVIDLASKLQESGGPYTVEFGETRACDGKPAEKYTPNSIEVRGVTLDGLNKLSRLSLKVSSEITERFEKRAGKGDREGWDHKKAKKVSRDDRGKKKHNFD